ncbi:syntaxin, putative [Plasmodium gallinaceum]|uniref:Syntaxin, putative n=1 Tax=Plasmodium gallinaceum TaxID=5849 RepID=A0A1J1GYK6_PLAGA|nr:syntaxin, putative [Plasmodium gallinaceum]CRG96099.1 syntaxin, putative [Plasmodium gallinaceum]
MSYSKKNDNKKLIEKNVYNYEFNSDIQKDIEVIQSYTLEISNISQNELCSIESSEKVQKIVQQGKIKIQEIQKKLKNCSNTEGFSQNEKVRKKLMLQKLSNSYMKAINNFQNASKNYINKTTLKYSYPNNFSTPDDLEGFNSFNNFSRNSSSNYDSNQDKFNVNIYDYNFYENKYENTYNSYKSNEFQSIDSRIEEKRKKKKYKNNIFTGNKKNEINEYLLQNDTYIENEKDNNYPQEKQFVSVKTVDIEKEILNQKNREIKKLHKDIINIQELYKELSEQINIQGENIDNIDSQIISTHDNIIMSGREIEIARNRYFRNFKCMFYIFIAILVLITIILVVLKVI